MSGWTADTWRAFCLLLEQGWPGEFPEPQRQAWRTLLDDISPVAAVAAVKRLTRAGGRFRPSVAELIAEAERDPSVPTFDEAYQLLFGPGGALAAQPPRGVYAGPAERERARLAAVEDRLRGMHPLVGSFVVRQGESRLRMLPVDGQHGELVRKDLRAAWVEHVSTLHTRQVATLTLADRAGGLRRLDPLAALRLRPDRPALTEGEAA